MKVEERLKNAKEQGNFLDIPGRAVYNDDSERL